MSFSEPLISPAPVTAPLLCTSVLISLQAAFGVICTVTSEPPLPPPPQPPAFSGKVFLTRFCQFPSQGDSRTPSRVKPGVILSLPPGYQCLGLHAGSMPKGTSDMHLERKAMPCSGDHLHCFLIASSLAASNLFPLSKCISIPAPVPFPCPLTNPRSAADAFPVPEQVLKIGIVLTDG